MPTGIPSFAAMAFLIRGEPRLPLTTWLTAPRLHPAAAAMSTLLIPLSASCALISR